MEVSFQPSGRIVGGPTWLQCCSARLFSSARIRARYSAGPAYRSIVGGRPVEDVITTRTTLLVTRSTLVSSLRTSSPRSNEPDHDRATPRRVRSRRRPRLDFGHPARRGGRSRGLRAHAVAAPHRIAPGPLDHLTIFHDHRRPPAGPFIRMPWARTPPFSSRHAVTISSDEEVIA